MNMVNSRLLIKELQNTMLKVASKEIMKSLRSLIKLEVLLEIA